MGIIVILSCVSMLSGNNIVTFYTESTLTNAGITDPETETWQRIMLAPGLELNVRLPLTEERRKAVEELKREAVRLCKSFV